MKRVSVFISLPNMFFWLHSSYVIYVEDAKLKTYIHTIISCQPDQFQAMIISFIYETMSNSSLLGYQAMIISFIYETVNNSSFVGQHFLLSYTG
uniref:Uncharacterized protein n=1 Tax=Arundo donax TaxID=35708 RepID=A0A0A9AXD3_ARUDO